MIIRTGTQNLYPEYLVEVYLLNKKGKVKDRVRGPIFFFANSRKVEADLIVYNFGSMGSLFLCELKVHFT